MRRNVTSKTLNDPRHANQPPKEAKSVQIDVYQAQRNRKLTTKGTQNCNYNKICISFQLFHVFLLVSSFLIYEA